MCSCVEIFQLRYSGTPPCFCAMLTKGNNCFFFHFASLANLNFSKWGQIFLEDRILSFNNWPIKKGGKKENGRVSFPERVSIHLQCRAA